MLNFKATWSQPINLVDGAKQSLTYTVADINQVPESPGAYVFVRIHGECVSPLYIGETANLRTRLDQHFKNNVKLMNSIKSAPAGTRAVIFCTIKTNSEKRRDAMLKVLQSALIEHALSEGHKLLNLQLTKSPFHMIQFVGNRTSEQIAPRIMYVQ